MKLRLGAFAGLVLAALLAFVPPARSAGINLSWNDCGESGSSNQSYECASGSGAPFKLIGSFIPPAGVGQFLGLSSELQIYSQQPILQDWWKHGAGQCRGASGLSVVFDFTGGPSSCTDVFAGQGVGGFAYDVGFASPQSARLRVLAAIPLENRLPVDAGTEYYAYQLQIARGTGNCGGCSGVACIALLSIQLFQPPEANYDPEITRPASRAHVSWQASSSLADQCTAANGSSSRTWGQVKSIWR